MWSILCLTIAVNRFQPANSIRPFRILTAQLAGSNCMLLNWEYPSDFPINPFEVSSVCIHQYPSLRSILVKFLRCKNCADRCGAKPYKYVSMLLKKTIGSNKRKKHQWTGVNNIGSCNWKWWKSLQMMLGQNKAPPKLHAVEDAWHNNSEVANKRDHFFSTMAGDCLLLETVKDISSTCTCTYEGIICKHLAKPTPSSEDFPAWFSKKIALDICVSLTNIINTIFMQRTIPAKWKHAEVGKLPNFANTSVEKEFCHISLLYHCRKVAKAIFLQECTENCWSNSVEDSLPT